MKTTPILFSTEMVRAILEGRKTQTRRVIKNIKHCEYRKMEHTAPGKYGAVFKDNNHFFKINCPYGKVGDVLWVRETWQTAEGVVPPIKDKYIYRAEASEIDGVTKRPARWESPIFMPKEACRIWLRITDIRVERVQDITEEDALSEGVEMEAKADLVFSEDPSGESDFVRYKSYTNESQLFLSAKNSFRSLWQSISGKESWEANPYVWAITFERIEKPDTL
jgi:hypothetical protein